MNDLNKKLMIIGAGGHGRVVADIATILGYEKIIFLDDSSEKKEGVLGPVELYRDYISEYSFFVAIGNIEAREKIFNRILNDGANIVSLVHPGAVVSGSAVIGIGVCVMAGSVINANAEIGNGVIINTCSSVDHDCNVGDFSHVSVGAHLAGSVSAGNKTMIGAGATVINNINICENVTIGAGAVVVNDIIECGTYVGVPARKMK